MQIFIPFNVPSSKNSRIFNMKMKRSFHSPIVTKYINNTDEFWKKYKVDFHKMIESLPYPLDIEFTFIRDSNRRFDYINPLQTVQDLMVKYDWIEDDNSKILRPFFGHSTVDKQNAGVLINLYDKKR